MDSKVGKKQLHKKSKKPIREKKSLLTKKSLHGAIKGLLNDVKREKLSSPTSAPTTTTTTTTQSSILPKCKKPSRTAIEAKSQRKHSRIRKDSSLEYTEKNGIIYIKSKENKMIRKLSDDEVMARHKRADQTMKDVWNKIIDKYESVQDQGDILNLQTGEIIEDHGHLRGENTSLPSVHNTVTNYKTSLNDILLQDESMDDTMKDKQIKNNNSADTSIWNNNDDTEDNTITKQNDEDEEDV